MKGLHPNPLKEKERAIVKVKKEAKQTRERRREQGQGGLAEQLS